jgi:hypothetical protein
VVPERTPYRREVMEPPVIAVQNLFELAAYYGIQLG